MAVAGARNNRFFWYRVLTLAALLLFDLQLSAEPIAQQIYEHQINQKCTQPSERELEMLGSCGTQDPGNKADLDATAEYLVFKPIADKELNKITCTLNEARQIRDDEPELKAAVDATCKKLPLLKEVLSTEKFYEGWIKTYSDVNDRSVRDVSDKDFASNQKVIDLFKKELFSVQQMETSLRFSDSLLGSPGVFEALQNQLSGGLISSGQTPDQACNSLRKNAKALINSDVSVLKQTQKIYQTELASKNWLRDGAFKSKLWESSSRDEVLGPLEKNKSFEQSTFCRMEGRYGEGARTRDAVYSVAVNAALFIFGGMTVSLGREAFLAADGGADALTATRLVAAADVTAGAGTAVQQIASACRDKIGALGDANACASQSNAALKSLYYQKTQAQSCLLAASVSAFALAAGVGTLSSLRGVSSDLAAEASLRQASLVRTAKAIAAGQEELNGGADATVEQAQLSLGRQLTTTEQAAVLKAHRVGQGQAGRDGTAAVVGNYTPSQLKQKVQILRKAGFDLTETRKLIKDGVVGDPAPKIANNAAAPKPSGAPAPPETGLTDQHFSELANLETEIHASTSEVQAKLGNAVDLSEAERQRLLSLYKGNSSQLSHQLDKLLTTTDGQAVESSVRKIRTELTQARIDIERKIAAALKDARLAKSTSESVSQGNDVGPTDLRSALSNASSLSPDKVYIVGGGASDAVKTASFSREVVKYFKNSTNRNPQSFLKAIQHGFVGSIGETGVKRLNGKLVELKIIGTGKSDRLIGCYENGSLSVLKVVVKRNSDRVAGEKYDGLCQ